MRKDLKIGEAGQQIVIDLLIKCGITSTIVDSKNKSYWDFSSTFKDSITPFKVEVKYDLYQARSGNIAIEFFNSKSGKPSGIGITKADLWAIVLSDKSVWITSTRTLKEFLKDNKPSRTILGGGDGNADLYLYPDTSVLAYFTRLDDKKEKNIIKILKDYLNG